MYNLSNAPITAPTSALAGQAIREQGPIESAMNQLKLELDMLEKAVAITEQRFDPVCRPAAPMPGGSDAKAAQAPSPLAIMILQCASRLHDAQVRLDLLHNRCEL